MEKKEKVSEKKENAEKKAHAHAKAGKEKGKSAFPIYLAILLIVFGILAGLVISSVFSSKPAQLPGGSANTGTFKETPVELKVIYNPDCKICYNGSVIEDLFKQKNIRFSVERLDMKITENGVLAGNYGMTSFPSTLVNWKQLKLADQQLYNIFKGIFPVSGDYMVIAEADLARETNSYSQIAFMEPPTEERCGVKNGTVRIDEFIDYFSRYSYENMAIIEGIKKDFNSNIELHYRNFPSSEASKEAAMAAECAREQGIFEEYKRALFAELFEKKRLTDANALKQIAREQNVPDLKAFDSCVDENKTLQKVESDTNAARQYGLFFAPSVVIDCIYTTIETTGLNSQVCAIHPDFNACKK